MSVMASRPILRWALPSGVLVAVLGAAVVSTQLRASADVTLPQRSPTQLLVDVQSAQVTGVSGTVVEKADLGLPALPESLGGSGSAQLNSLISGSHTLRVWYSGPDRTRVALLGAVGESDIIRNGDDAWVWSSSDDAATHLNLKAVGWTVPSSGGVATMPGLTTPPTTPEQAAEQALTLLGANTTVSTEPGTKVAGRSAYQLSLAPKDPDSLIAKIRVAIDSGRHVPTRVEIFAKGQADPAFSIGFSQISFNRPDDERFAFTPPPGAKVTDETGRHAALNPADQPPTAVIGAGWSSVLAVRLPANAAGLPGGAAGTSPAATSTTDSNGSPLGALLGALPRVSGSWGSGRLLESRLFSVLLTDDGRILVGAVGGDRLARAAADPAAGLR
jgi:outer membrane lipoprotein-sorting protein